jgi:hypothetical protein
MESKLTLHGEILGVRYFFEIKCKVSIFFTSRLSSRKVYQKKLKKCRGCHLKKLLMTSLLGYDNLST